MDMQKITYSPKSEVFADPFPAAGSSDTKICKELTFFVTALLFVLSCSSQVVSINTDSNGVAIKGYDTVAYFTKNKPTRGKAEFQHTWKSAKWFFENKEHLKLFQENPAAYAPQYGAY